MSKPPKHMHQLFVLFIYAFLLFSFFSQNDVIFPKKIGLKVQNLNQRNFCMHLKIKNIIFPYNFKC